MILVDTNVLVALVDERDHVGGRSRAHRRDAGEERGERMGRPRVPGGQRVLYVKDPCRA